MSQQRQGGDLEKIIANLTDGRRNVYEAGETALALKIKAAIDLANGLGDVPQNEFTLKLLGLLVEHSGCLLKAALRGDLDSVRLAASSITEGLIDLRNLG